VGELIVDCFAGGGGVSTGIEMALGRSPDIAINHDAVALAMHKANHPDTHHLNSNIFKVVPSEACAGRPIGMLWLSPDCFVPGTLILTPKGLEPIEAVGVGDMVLTHRGRWRRVTSTMTREEDTVEVRGQGHYGLITTPAHQFYSKVITKRWPRGKNGKGRRPGLQRTLVENPYWPQADQMAGRLWATPRAFPGASMPLPPVTIGDDFFYFLGRWIGDGSINKGDVEICCGTRECEEFEQWIAAHPLRDREGEIIPCRIVDHGSSRLFVWGNAGLQRWLEQEVLTGSERKRRPDNQKETTFSDTLHIFSGVREVKPSGIRTVVSLQVEEDESFVADGIVVHNCKHFSRAKGAKPVEKRIRGLAWVALHWAQLPPWQRPRVIFLENVPEFLTWGPLLEDGRPDPERKGEEFQKFVKALKRAGYSQVEWQTVRMCNYGDPTIRQRLCLIARCDGEPIVWPAHTNGDPKSEVVSAGNLPAWRTAAEDVIDWSIPCPSIFLSKAEVKKLYDEFGIRVQRPLKPKTMARIFKGLVRDRKPRSLHHSGDARGRSAVA
jgi:site-specific DNA-cytosine methylase